MALKLNPATKKALAKELNPKGYLRDFLLSSKTATELAELVADYYIAEASEAPKVVITKEQLDKFFEVAAPKVKKARAKKAE